MTDADRRALIRETTAEQLARMRLRASNCSSAIARCVTVSKARVGEGLVSIEYSSPMRPTARL